MGEATPGDSRDGPDRRECGATRARGVMSETDDPTAPILRRLLEASGFGPVLISEAKWRDLTKDFPFPLPDDEARREIEAALGEYRGFCNWRNVERRPANMVRKDLLKIADLADALLEKMEALDTTELAATADRGKSSTPMLDARNLFLGYLETTRRLARWMRTISARVEPSMRGPKANVDRHFIAVVRQTIFRHAGVEIHRSSSSDVTNRGEWFLFGIAKMVNLNITIGTIQSAIKEDQSATKEDE
jgi:hypothetical protein